MTWLQVVIIALFNCILSLFLANYLPSYMDKKGENLATREDIQEITELTEEVQQEFRKEIEQFKTDLDFKHEFYYKQYEGLYCYLYAIIVQSEYVRQYLKTILNQEFAFDEAPFITISPIHRERQEHVFREGERIRISGHSEEVETPMSQYNFDQLVEYIIANSALADQELMKLAVSYRFAHFVTSTKEQSAAADEEETRLQVAILGSVIKTYNWLRKELKMSFLQSELDNGDFELV